MGGPVLAGLGVRVEEGQVYSQLLELAREGRIGAESVSNAFILELKHLVGLQGPARAGVAGNKMTVRQACHVLAVIGGDKESYKKEEMITDKMKKRLWRTTDLDTLEKEVAAGTRNSMAPWPRLSSAFAPAAAIKSAAPGDGGAVSGVYGGDDFYGALGGGAV